MATRWRQRSNGIEVFGFRWENDILIIKTCCHTFSSETVESGEPNSKTELCCTVSDPLCVLLWRWWSLRRVFSPVCVLHHLIDRLTDWCCQHGARYQTRRDQACQPSPLPSLTSHIVTSSLGDTDFTERRWPLCLTSCRLMEGSKSETSARGERIKSQDFIWWLCWRLWDDVVVWMNRQKQTWFCCPHSLRLHSDCR